MTRYSILLCMIICMFTQCKPNQTDQTSEVNTDSLQIQLQVLNDSLQTSWQTMIDSDNSKINHIDKLLKGIAKSCPYDKVVLDQLSQKQSTLTSKRYISPDSLTNEQIDSYDAATDSLLTALSSFYEKTHATTCCVSCDSLKNEIYKLNDLVGLLRGRYDNYAKEYNALITQQKDALERLKPEYRSLKPKQIFSIMQ